MNPFTKKTVAFFKDLAGNNTGDWFKENKKRYEEDVKQPFAAFTQHMIDRIAKHDASVKIAAADAIFRINKDVRFSKDKSPYKTYMSANISPFGRKDKAYPGFYFQVGAEGVAVFGGAYMPDKDQLERIRERIAKQPAAFRKAVEGKAFLKYFGEVQGERQKRLSGVAKDHADSIPWIANKQFYFRGSMPASAITSRDLADELIARYLAGKPLNDFLAQALR